MDGKIPVTILTGFLGAGKTTLLNNLLAQLTAERLAIIVNEFGTVSIDDKLIEHAEEDILTLRDGAMCCAAHNDVGHVLEKLYERPDLNPDRVLIETTGLANPAPLARALIEQPALAARYELAGIVTLVDASHIVEQLKSTPEAKTQIATADVIVLNKTDLVDERTRVLVKTRLRGLNPLAPIRETVRSAVRLTDLDPGPSGQAYVRDLVSGDAHDHDAEIQTFVLRAERPLDLAKVTRWVGERLVLDGDKLLRYKGLLDIAGLDERFVFQGVHRHFENRPDRAWRPDEARVSQVVVIGKDLDEAAWQAEFAGLTA